MTILKAILLALSGTLFARAITPPTPTVTKEKAAVYKGQPFEYIVRQLAWLGCILVVLSSIAHTILLLIDGSVLKSTPASSLIPYLCPSNPLSLAPISTFSSRFITGLLLITAGGLFRLWSYHALGELFTYEVNVSDAHHLVTSGPYKYLRHPSYTGLTVLLIGAHLVHQGPSSYSVECGIDRTWMIVWVWIWRTGTVFGVASLYRRCRIEDGNLKERFGDVWVEYSQRVKYRVWPLVF
ncbi:hypothetical protein C2E23DRAFT_740927 [Lenzites betulinus]|nr:hypothetical protein C2E23DRAFT_740927 [Lenzites betulinus]